ncbi:MAG: TRAP transporter small permease subunit [Pseudomonadota bacterium]
MTPSPNRAIGVLRPICALWAVLGGMVLISIMAITTINASAFLADRIASGFGGNVAGLSGYEDFVSLAIAGAVTSFFPWCQLQRGHLAVQLFKGRGSDGLWRRITLLWDLLLIATVAFLAWMLFQGALEARADGNQTAILGWPVWQFMLPPVLSLALWSVIATTQLFGKNDAVA